MNNIYEAFKFHIEWNGNPIAGFNKVSGLTTTPDPGSPHINYGAITLEEGITGDLEFETWLNKIWDYTNSTSSAEQPISKDFRDISIELYNEAGEKVFAYNVYQCWVSEYEPSLNTGINVITIQSVRLENSGWKRDTSFFPPSL